MQAGAPTDPMFHRHLVLGYSFAWALQLSYLAYVARKKLTTPTSADSEDRAVSPDIR